MSKHTPGPWFISGSMTKYVEARIGGGMLQEVAACGPTDADGGYGETQLANANLIAAAPDLLAALEGLLDQMRRPPNEGDYHKLDIAPCLKAITKAKGHSK